MKEKITLKMPKGLFIAAMVASILVFVTGLILDIVNVYYFSNYWLLLVSLILDVFLCIFFICASVTILLWKPENKGGTLLLAADIYVLACGFVSALSNIMSAIHFYEFSYVIPSILSVLQVAVGSMVIILRNRRVTAAKVISIVCFGWFAINSVAIVVLKNDVGNLLLSISSTVSFLFDAFINVVFCLMRKSDPEESKADKAGALE